MNRTIFLSSQINKINTLATEQEDSEECFTYSQPAEFMNLCQQQINEIILKLNNSEYYHNLLALRTAIYEGKQIIQVSPQTISDCLILILNNIIQISQQQDGNRWNFNQQEVELLALTLNTIINHQTLPNYRYQDYLGNVDLFQSILYSQHSILQQLAATIIYNLKQDIGEYVLSIMKLNYEVLFPQYSNYLDDRNNRILIKELLDLLPHEVQIGIRLCIYINVEQTSQLINSNCLAKIFIYLNKVSEQENDFVFNLLEILQNSLEFLIVSKNKSVLIELFNLCSTIIWSGNGINEHYSFSNHYISSLQCLFKAKRGVDIEIAALKAIDGVLFTQSQVILLSDFIQLHSTPEFLILILRIIQHTELEESALNALFGKLVFYLNQNKDQIMKFKITEPQIIEHIGMFFMNAKTRLKIINFVQEIIWAFEDVDGWVCGQILDLM
ncbi:Hypothetical_protein [Hexamita inflata]|uniref:Hypothetical_protein n=1 Tax=Hexamita inflata TaxID=28002 RepID=A0AA86NVD6_9EUKA|nr:Hypothetical protein HINF_LOCUS14937 [Hexamita inflata]